MNISATASRTTSIPKPMTMMIFSAMTADGSWQMHTDRSITATSVLPWEEAGQSGEVPVTATLAAHPEGEGTRFELTFDVDLSSMPAEFHASHRDQLQAGVAGELEQMVAPIEALIRAQGGPELG